MNAREGVPTRINRDRTVLYYSTAEVDINMGLLPGG